MVWPLMPPWELTHFAQAVTEWAMGMERPGPVWVVMSPMRMTPPLTPALGTAAAPPCTAGLPAPPPPFWVLRVTLDPCAPGAAVGPGACAAARPRTCSPGPVNALA